MALEKNFIIYIGWQGVEYEVLGDYWAKRGKAKPSVTFNHPVKVHIELCAVHLLYSAVELCLNTQ